MNKALRLFCVINIKNHTENLAYFEISSFRVSLRKLNYFCKKREYFHLFLWAVHVAQILLGELVECHGVILGDKRKEVTMKSPHFEN